MARTMEFSQNDLDFSQDELDNAIDDLLAMQQHGVEMTSDRMLLAYDQMQEDPEYCTDGRDPAEIIASVVSYPHIVAVSEMEIRILELLPGAVEEKAEYDRERQERTVRHYVEDRGMSLEEAQEIVTNNAEIQAERIRETPAAEAAAQYVAENPDWEEKHQSFIAAAEALNSIGQQAIKEGLTNGDVEQVEAGRRLMAYATQSTLNINDQESLTWRVADGMRTGAQAQDPMDKANAYLYAHNIVMEICREQGVENAANSAAKLVMNSERQALYQQSQQEFPSVDYGEPGDAARGIGNELMSTLTDRMYHDTWHNVTYRQNQDGPMEWATQAMADDNMEAVGFFLSINETCHDDIRAIAHAYPDATHFEDAIVAEQQALDAVPAEHQPQYLRNLAQQMNHAANGMNSLEGMEQHANNILAMQMLSTSAAMLMQAAREMEMRQGRRYDLRDAILLRECSSDNAIRHARDVASAGKQ